MCFSSQSANNMLINIQISAWYDEYIQVLIASSSKKTISHKQCADETVGWKIRMNISIISYSIKGLMKQCASYEIFIIYLKHEHSCEKIIKTSISLDLLVVTNWLAYYGRTKVICRENSAKICRNWNFRLIFLCFSHWIVSFDN